MLLHEATSAQRRENRLYVAGAAVAICLLAWLALWFWENSAYSRFLSHHSLDTVGGDWTLLPVYLAGWLTMLVAMMLPTTLPILLTVERRAHSRSGAAMGGLLLVVGYLLSWTVVGIVIYVGDWLLHQATHRSAAPIENMWIIAALIPIMAGIYQFTPLKRTFLEACRSSSDCATLHEHGKIGAREWMAAGVRHGLCCIGCCWALMLLMFASGAGNVAWMAGLALVMLVEKWLPRGQRLLVPIGIVLVVWGSLTLLGILPHGTQHHHHEQVAKASPAVLK